MQYKYKATIQHTELGPQVSLDVAGSIIYKQMNLMTYLEKLGMMDSGQLTRSTYDVQKELAGMKLKVTHRETDSRVVVKSLTDEPAGQVKTDPLEDGQVMTVKEYFQQKYNMNVNPGLPCVQTSRTRRIFYPMEVLDIVSEQQFKRAIPRSALKNIHLPPQDRLRKIKGGLASINSSAAGTKTKITLGNELIKVKGRVLAEDQIDRRGRFADPRSINRWVVINCENPRFLNPNVVRAAVQAFQQTGRGYGMNIANPVNIVDSDKRPKNYANTLAQFAGKVDFALVIIPQHDDFGLYKGVKKDSWTHTGIPVQVCLGNNIRNERGLRSYMRNLLLKVNVKMGGTNFKPSRPIMPPSALVFGMDVSHGALNADTTGTGETSRNSTVAMICSTNCRCAYASQPPRTEIVSKDVMLELLEECVPKQGRQPTEVLFYRDGVSNTMFGAVEANEIAAIEERWPGIKVTFVILQKRHRTRFFKMPNPNDSDRVENLDPGTVIDTKVTEAGEFDFFLCAHKGIIGTSRVPHYIVIRDDMNYPADKMQAITHKLSQVFQRSFGAVSQTCASYYAHVLADKCRVVLEGNGTFTKMHPNFKKISHYFFL